MVPKVHAGFEMAMAGNNDEDITRNWKERIASLGEKMTKYLGLAWRTMWKVGREDPRRVIHAFKVGLSLTLVSLLYLLEPLYEGIGQNAIWAVMTVVVVLEFTAGQFSFLSFSQK